MFENSYICGSDISYFSRRHNVLRVRSSNFHKFIYKICLTWLTDQGGEGSFFCCFLKIERSDPICWRQCPDCGDLWVNLSLIQF